MEGSSISVLSGRSGFQLSGCLGHLRRPEFRQRRLPSLKCAALGGLHSGTVFWAGTIFWCLTFNYTCRSVTLWFSDTIFWKSLYSRAYIRSVLYLQELLNMVLGYHLLRTTMFLFNSFPAGDGSHGAPAGHLLGESDTTDRAIR